MRATIVAHSVSTYLFQPIRQVCPYFTDDPWPQICFVRPWLRGCYNPRLARNISYRGYLVGRDSTSTKRGRSVLSGRRRIEWRVLSVCVVVFLVPS